jgi:hypothetical protein
MVIRPIVSQTADMTQWQNYLGATVAGVDIYGNAGFGGATPASGYGLKAFTNGNASVVGILVKGASGQTANLQEWQNSSGTVLASLSASGVFSAISKSFLIDHPTKPGKKLRHGSLEGPENGVYVRGTITDNIIELPEYWTALVDPESITVSLTAIGKYQRLSVKKIEGNRVYIRGPRRIHAHYVVFAERADTPRLQLEE